MRADLGADAAGKVLIDEPLAHGAARYGSVFRKLRVLIALRDPRDVVLSCYFQNLPLDSTNVNFLSLDRLANATPT